MIRIAVLDDYQKVAHQMADWASLGPSVNVDFFHRHLSLETAAVTLHDYDVVVAMRERMPIPEELIERLPNLKLLVFTGHRVSAIDIVAAARRNILVCNTRSGGNQYPAVEIAWGLILSLMRNIPQEIASMREGDWQNYGVGTPLAGRTLGVLGVGKLGGRMAEIARAFGMCVIGWSQNLTTERAAEAGVVRVSRDDLFRKADVVSVHLVLSDRTRGLVGDPEFALMKRTAHIVNTSRGPIINEDALLRALASGRIAGAGLDVFDNEPLPADHPLRRMPGTLLTPHLGYATEDSYRTYYEGAVEAISAWLVGKPVMVVEADTSALPV